VCLRVCLNEIKKDRMKWRLMCCSFNVRRNLKRESKRTKDRLLNGSLFVLVVSKDQSRI